MHTYFNSDFNAFFKALAANNNKDWMDANRNRYIKNIREPLKVFIFDFIGALGRLEQPYHLELRDALFRINHDIRFSPDKTPYKLHGSAIVSPGGKHARGVVKFYIQLGPGGIVLAGGVYQPTKEERYALRSCIAKDLKGWKAAKSEPDFLKHYDGIDGAKNKVIPKEFKQAAVLEPDLYNKSFLYQAELDPNLVTSPSLLPVALEYYKAGLPVKQFLEKGLKAALG